MTMKTPVNPLLTLIGMAVVVLAPMAIESNYYLHLLIMICIYVTLTTGLNLVIGYAGQGSLCHGALYGFGAYASALLTTHLGFPVYVAFLLAGLIAAILGLPIALPSLRLKGVYFSVATLGLQEIAFLVNVNWISLTHGPMGIVNVPPLTFAGKPLTMIQYYWAGLIMVALTYALVKLIVLSRTGRELQAIREDETAARAMGINTYGLKVMAFVVSAFIAGLAGAFFAHYFKFVSPDSFRDTVSVTLFVMLLAGGRGTLMGPVLGAGLLTILPEFLRMARDYQLLFYGLALIVLTIFFPKGVVGWWESRVSPERGRGPRRPDSGGGPTVGRRSRRKEVTAG